MHSVSSGEASEKLQGKYCVVRDVLAAAREMAARYDWCEAAEKKFDELGLMHKVEVDREQVKSWCGSRNCPICEDFGEQYPGLLIDDMPEDRFPFQDGTPEIIEAEKLFNASFDASYSARWSWIVPWLVKNSFTERGAKRIASRRAKEARGTQEVTA